MPSIEDVPSGKLISPLSFKEVVLSICLGRKEVATKLCSKFLSELKRTKLSLIVSLWIKIGSEILSPKSSQFSS